ncbi:hypothetical protein SLS62_002876 [Diatrype stigma]|uniref:Uncharacterized protein n=1 Tax=Diatrype stigma TaxID=117547 RepID=A0AAN9YRU3_9PEZI
MTCAILDGAMEAFRSIGKATMETGVNSSTTDQILGEIGLDRTEDHRIRGIIPIAKMPIRYRPSPLRHPCGSRRPRDFRDSVLESRHHHPLTVAAVVGGMDTTETTVEVMAEEAMAEQAMAEGAMADMPRHCRHHLLTMAMEASIIGLPHRAAVIETVGRTIMGGVTEVGAGIIDR